MYAKQNKAVLWQWNNNLFIYNLEQNTLIKVVGVYLEWFWDVTCENILRVLNIAGSNWNNAVVRMYSEVMAFVPWRWVNPFKCHDVLLYKLLCIIERIRRIIAANVVITSFRYFGTLF
jgi:hypothetical protein